MSGDDVVISVNNVSKTFKLPHEKNTSVKSALINSIRQKRIYEEQQALKGISFEVKKGEFFGIVGRNGSGKSTLLKIIASIYQPTQGTLEVSGKLVPFIELGVGFNPELTGRENVYLNGALLGFSEKEVSSMYKDIVEFAELGKFMDQKLKNYSSGMQVRLAFSMAIRSEADILLIDEVLAVGDASFQRKCFEYFKDLKANRKTVIFVTHDMSAVREFCDRAMLINNSENVLIGDPQEVAKEYSMLFIDENSDGNHGTSKHWGNGDIKVTDVKTALVDDELIVDVQASIHKEVARIIYGLHIVSQDGVEVTAMNNRMILAPDIEKLLPGQKVYFKWKMLNVFNDGKYSITLTIIDNLATTLDWVTNAATFTVKRPERSTTAVLPPVEVEHTIKL
jgi:ABC-2 type transport system ATP-binding protein